MKLAHILCPVDFSPGARVALMSAAEIARDAGARLTLLHVHEPPDSDALAALPELLEKLRRSAGRELEEWRRDAAAHGAPWVETMTARGVPWHEICEVARARDCGVIVMGTAGVTGIRHALLGSVAERVARHAHCPVLVVRPSA